MHYPQPMFHPLPAACTPGCNEQNQIIVTGSGTVSIQPDRALITVGVITENKDLAASQAENAERTTSVIQSLIALGIPQDAIKTTEYRIDTMYDYVEGKQILRGYQTTHQLQVTTDQIAQTGRIVDTAVASGANSVSNIQFSLAHPELAYNQALDLALRDSQQKAITLAQSLHVNLSLVPAKITETTLTPTPAPSPVAFSAKRVQTPIEPGMLQITASIVAEFHY